MTELTTAWMLGCVWGFFLGVTVAGRRRPTCRELMRDPAPPYRRDYNPFESEFQRRINDSLGLTEGRTQRGNSNGGPTTPKPQFPPPQRIREDFLP